ILPRSRLISKFNTFCSDHLDVGSEAVANEIESGLDFGVSGSDQIWNPTVTGGLDSRYFLAHTRAAKKISFSSSFGSHKYDDAEIEQLSNLLSDYSHLAVREQDAATYLSDLIGRQVYQTPDPTLLLRKESWEKIASPSTGI